jgi:hypothetical protein
MDQFPHRDQASFFRRCSRNRGGAGPGDFFDEAALISKAEQLFSDYAAVGSRLYLREVATGAMLAEIDVDGRCIMQITGIVGLRDESTILQLTRPYPTRMHRGDGD